MSNSEQLRKNTNQHTPKNMKSKEDDKKIVQAQREVEKYLQKRFSDYFTEEQGYYTDLEKNISYEIMYKFIKDKKLRKEFDTSFKDRIIVPDRGGVSYILKTRKIKIL